MDGIIVGFISIGLLVAINIAISAFNYGKLSQNVIDLNRRMDAHTKDHIALRSKVEAHLEKGSSL